MASKEYLQKLREDRLAREQARINKLRELNLKKYSHEDSSKINVKKSTTIPKKVPDLISSVKPEKEQNSMRPTSAYNGGEKKDLMSNASNLKSNASNLKSKIPSAVAKKPIPSSKFDIKKIDSNKVPTKEINKTNTVNVLEKKANKPVNENLKLSNIQKSNKPVPQKPERKTIFDANRTIPMPKNSRKSCAPDISNTKRESVFDRLYKPKTVHTIQNVHKHPDPKPVLQKAHSRQSIALNKAPVRPSLPARRSISAVHLKKINKEELSNCFHKWASIGDKINEVSHTLGDGMNEMVSAVKSERKKVQFRTPVVNADEMRVRLEKWLQKHGKSLDSYHHLQCFGIKKMYDVPMYAGYNNKEDKVANKNDEFIASNYDEENKENIALDNDSDNESYSELNGLNKWRNPSCMDSVDYSEINETTLTSYHSPQVNELLVGALKDLTDIIRSGYNSEEGARWLRAIYETYPNAHELPAYWECRAALEEGKVNFKGFLACWGTALNMGAEESVAEANLDQLLSKFMTLNINPSPNKQVDPKIVDAKNVFKSTLLRFAVQEAKANATLTPKFIVTPVRRSARLHTRMTPLKVFNTIQQAVETENAEFKPNRAIIPAP